MKNLFKDLKMKELRGAISPVGVAFENKNQRIIAYDKTKDELVDVTEISEIMDDVVFGIPTPINAIKKGDIVIHNDVPVIVKVVKDKGKGFQGIDIFEEKEVIITPATSILGFNYIIKCTSMFDGMNLSNSTDNNNMLCTLAMLNKDDSSDMFSTMMIMSAMNGGDTTNFFGDMTSNPMMGLMMMKMMNKKGGSDDKENFMEMILMQQIMSQNQELLKK